MSKVTYPICKIDDRIFFKPDDKYVLLDTGFPSSCATDGKIGPFRVQRIEKDFFDSFINLAMPDGSKASGVLTPMNGYNCHLTPEGLTITDEPEPLPKHDFFLPFVKETVPFLRMKLPIVEGTMNGTDIRFYVDCGARMTMFGEPELTGGKPATGSYKEWLAMVRRYEPLPIYDVVLDFPCGLHYEGRGAMVCDLNYTRQAMMMDIRAMLGIDVFNTYDVYFSTANQLQGIALIRRG